MSTVIPQVSLNAKTDPGFRLSIWKAIELGAPGFRTLDELCAALLAEGMQVPGEAREMLKKIEVVHAGILVVSPVHRRIDLFRVSGSDLGFTGRMPYSCICSRAEEFGLRGCPQDVGVQLRRQYKDQPPGECLQVVSDSIFLDSGKEAIFAVAHNRNGLQLVDGYGFSKIQWDPTVKWVFTK